MIDLRSDLCTTPTEAMWEAMRSTPLGFSSFGPDAALERLERSGAELLGKEEAAFVLTGTMANIAVLLAFSPRGERVVLERSAHIVCNEGDGIGALAGLEPVLLDGRDGHLEPAAVAAALDASGASLLCLENTHTRAGGTVLDGEATAALAAVARAAGARVHLDGARLANAAVALGVAPAALAAPVDTVAFSLTKGLAAPFGTLLAGGADEIAAVRVQLKRLGGGSLHKAGIAAAAGLVALDTMLDGLAEDHRRAYELAGLLRARGLRLEPEHVETNIVNVRTPGPAAPVVERLAALGVLALTLDGERVRLVTHRLIGDADLPRAAAAFEAALAPGADDAGPT